ncbi:hypothetical protein [Marininema halotolerans]|uniref:Uncharacterized protein n=1 Tax=Marininema halotolerans TaxID=1155944 RepID=A0A1I6R3L9_9BACL|nr:hypothetical protein [Marininema halotolerans]SFS59283.1 hypothetical protein SAMN05444972_10486 [Marininema halotolerans]
MSNDWGQLPGIFCPAFSEQGEGGLALEDGYGMAVIDNQFSLISKTDKTGAWYVNRGSPSSLPQEGRVGDWNITK